MGTDRPKTGPRTELDLVQSRWQKLRTDYRGRGWKAHHAQLTQYIQPRMGRYFHDENNRDTLARGRNATIVDSTAGRAVKMLAAGMQSGMSSPHQPWVRLRLPNSGPLVEQEVQKWLDEVVALMLRVLARSNFYRVVAQMYEELAVFGTAAAIVLPDFDNVLHCYPLTAGQYFIATNSKGRVVTLYRELQMTVAQLVDEFGEDKVSDSVLSQFRHGELDNWIDVVHAIEPRADRDREKADTRNMPWRSIYFEAGQKNANVTQVLRESGFPQFPAVVPRWSVTPGDVYGHSPGMEVLPDLIQLQEMQEVKGKAMHYAAEPPVQMPTEAKYREVDLRPGGRSYVDGQGPNSGIRTVWEVGTAIQPLVDDIRETQATVRSSFFVDLFLMLHQNDGPQMTAREVSERQSEKLLMLGPVLERLDNELLRPAIELVFGYMSDAGILPEPPESIAGQPIVPEFVSVLAQAQRMAGINTVDRFMASVAAAGEVWPEVTDLVDVDAWANQTAQMFGIPQSMLREKEVVDSLRKARADAQAAQQALAAQEQAAGAAKNAAQAQAALPPVDPVGMAGGFQQS